jgi:hypothetical protein
MLLSGCRQMNFSDGIMARNKICHALLLLSLCLLVWVHEIVFAAQVQPHQARTRITGEVSGGKVFEQTFAPGFYFCLDPTPFGWLIAVRDKRRTEDISRLTPPFHFVPNPREIEGWHFRNADNSGPNEAGEQNINAPGEIREFIFSPEVGKTVNGPDAKRQPTPEEIEQVGRFGRGKLKILDYRLGDLKIGQQAKFEWMRFEVDLSWPSAFKP